MRIWSLHPRFLDVQGLLALWREALLAQKVLQGETKGYVHHPQLVRFKISPDPLACIAAYLDVVYRESLARGYHFDKTKVEKYRAPGRMSITSEQLSYEWELLTEKLRLRDVCAYERISGIKNPEPHPMFEVVAGPIELWEIINDKK